MAEVSQRNLIRELGLEDLPEERQMEILLGIERIVQQNVILRILDELKEKDKKEFDKFLAKKGNDQEAVLKFLESRIPNLNQIVNEEIEKITKEAIEFMSKLTEPG
jgi:transcriptional regulator of heat shock response